MLQDGGTPVLSTSGAMVDPGGQTVPDGHLAYHFDDVDQGGDVRLAVRELVRHDRWPVAATGKR